MDLERQAIQNKGFSFKGLKEQMQETATHPSVSTTLIVFLILNVVMLIVGFIHMKDCPVKKMIPIYLIVAGSVGIESKLLPFINRKLEFEFITYIVYALYIFEFVWTLLGSYWVYSIFKPNFNKNTPLYCDQTAYRLAFWLLTINWVLFGITIILACCAAICIALIKK